jgi:hypothetical protein
MQTFTFVCRQADLTATHIDVQMMEARSARDHASDLLVAHPIASMVEIWCEPALIDQLEREDVADRPDLSEAKPSRSPTTGL